MTGNMQEIQALTKKRNRKQMLRIFFGRGILVKVCTVFLVLFVILSLLAPVISPYDPNQMDLLSKLKGPSSAHWLGTDYLGRDVLSRLIYGGRVSLAVSLLAGTFAAVIGIALGLVAGYFGGVIGKVIMGATDVVLSIPGLVFTMVIAAIMGKSVMSMTIAIGIGMIPTYILLPNTFPSLIVLFTINLGNAIMTESSLSYLGIGISPPTATWGNMVYDAYAYLLKAPQLAIIPGVCIIVLIIAFNVVGDGLRDALDPRLRGKM